MSNDQACVLCLGQLEYYHSNEPLEETWCCTNCLTQYTVPLERVAGDFHKRIWVEMQLIEEGQ
jgi:hypothetical protein